MVLDKINFYHIQAYTQLRQYVSNLVAPSLLHLIFNTPLYPLSTTNEGLWSAQSKYFLTNLFYRSSSKSDFVCYDINEIVGKAGSHKHKPDETDKA